MMRHLTKAAFFGILGLCVIGQAAVAADLPVRKAPPAPVYVPYNWNGWYVGAHLGYGWGDKGVVDVRGDTGVPPGTQVLEHDVSGWLAGFQAGWNYQTGNWLFGIEGQWSWTGIDGSGSATVPAGPLEFATDVDWIATLTARLGIVSDRWLWYLKGGGAWAKDQYTETVVGVFPTFTPSETRSGWTVGLGVEYAWGNNWSSKLEWNYLDFGDDQVLFGVTPARIDQKIHIVKVGLNYKFDWGKTPAPVAARY
jgi:outer membrane immunogenic protein